MRAQALRHCGTVTKHEVSGLELISKPLQLKGCRVVKVTSTFVVLVLHLFSAGDETAIGALRSAPILCVNAADYN